jgi:hypothetical protein
MTQNDILALVKKQAKVGNDEVAEIGNSLLNRWVDAAMRTHNATLTYDSIPDREVDCIVLLVWRKVCLWRAGKFAQDTNTRSGTDYVQDSGTPYKKNIELAKQLLDEYKQLVTDLKLLPVGESILQGTLLVENEFTGGIGPSNAIVTPNAPVLSVGSVTSTTIILRWIADYFSDFESFLILSDIAPNIFQDWNMEGVFGIPKIRGDVEKDGEVVIFQNQAVKVTGLLPATVYYFMVVMRSRNGICSYSNEVQATTAA